MFDGSDESDDNHSNDSDWSEEFWENEKHLEQLSGIEVNESFHYKTNTSDYSEENYECDDVSSASSAPYELIDITENNDSSDSDDASKNNDLPESIEMIVEEKEEGEVSEGEIIPFSPITTSTIVHDEDCVSIDSESDISLSYSVDDQHASEESHESTQVDDGNESYRGTELSDDDSFLYFNSDSYNDTQALYPMECNSPAFLNSRASGGFATIIRAFSAWAEMEQLEKPPPPAAKDVVDNLGSKEVTEKSYQCPVCLGICEIGEILKVLPCSHAFHTECILPWLEKTNTCPLCRNEMPTDNEDYELFKAIEAGRQLRI